MKKKYVVNSNTKISRDMTITASAMLAIYFAYFLWTDILSTMVDALSAGNSMSVFASQINWGFVIYRLVLIILRFVGIIIFTSKFCTKRSEAVIFCMIPNLLCELAEMFRNCNSYIVYASKIREFEDKYGTKVNWSISSRYGIIGLVVINILLATVFVLFALYILGKFKNKNLFMGIVAFTYVHTTIYTVFMILESTYDAANIIIYVGRMVQMLVIVMLFINLKNVENKEDKVLQMIKEMEEDSTLEKSEVSDDTKETDDVEALSDTKETDVVETLSDTKESDDAKEICDEKESDSVEETSDKEETSDMKVSDKAKDLDDNVDNMTTDNK